MGSTFSIKALLGLEATGFHAEMQKAGKRVDDFALSKMGAVKGAIAAAFSVAAIEEWIRKSIQMASNINDMADQWRVSTDEVQRFQKVAAAHNLKPDVFGGLVSSLMAARRAAGEGDLAKQMRLAEFGVSMQKVTDKSVDMGDILTLVSQRLNSMQIDDGVITRFETIAGTTTPRMIQALRDLSTEIGKTPPIFNKQQLSELEQVEIKLKAIGKALALIPAKHILDITETGRKMEKRNSAFFALSFPWLRGAMQTFGFLPTQEDINKGVLDKGAAGKPDVPTKETATNNPNGGSGQNLYINTGQRERQAQMYQSVYEIQQQILHNEMQTMGVERQRQKIQEQITRLMQAAEGLTDPQNAAKNYSKVADLIGQMQGLTMQPYKMNLNQLQQIGGYSGPIRDTTLTTNQRIESTVKQMSQDLKQAVNHLNSINRDGGFR